MKKNKKEIDNNGLFKSEVHRIVKKQLNKLMLKSWDVNVRIESRESDYAPEGKQVAADVHSDHTYMSATLAIYPACKKRWEKDKETLEETIVHELIHCVTERFRNCAAKRYTTEEDLREANENLVQHITRIICWNGQKEDSIKIRKDVKKTTTKRAKAPIRSRR